MPIRTRPWPRGSWTSTATATRDFLPLARPPLSPGSSPPMKVSPPPPCRSGGRVGADLQRPLQAQRRDAVLLRSEHPASSEPHRQRRPPLVEQGARGHRGTRPAAGALVPAITDRPPTGVVAARAHEAVRSAQPLQVVQAVGVGREPGLELPGRPRVVVAGPRLPHVHAAIIVRSAEYPRLPLSLIGCEKQMSPLDEAKALRDAAHKGLLLDKASGEKRSYTKSRRIKVPKSNHS